MRETMKRAVAMLLATVLVFGVAQKTQGTTALAANKIQVLTKEPKEISLSFINNKKRIKQLIKNKGIESVYKYKGKKYTGCNSTKKGVISYNYYKMSALKNGKEVMKTKKLFKGYPVTIEANKDITIPEYGEATYSIKVKKGIKLIALGVYNEGVKTTSVEKDKITLKAGDSYSANSTYLYVRVLFSYKGKKYCIPSYYLTGSTGKSVVVRTIEKETEDTEESDVN